MRRSAVAGVTELLKLEELLREELKLEDELLLALLRLKEELELLELKELLVNTVFCIFLITTPPQPLPGGTYTDPFMGVILIIVHPAAGTSETVWKPTGTLSNRAMPLDSLVAV